MKRGVGFTGRDERDDYHVLNGFVSNYSEEWWSVFLSGVFWYLEEGLKGVLPMLPHLPTIIRQTQNEVKPALPIRLLRWRGHPQWTMDNMLLLFEFIVVFMVVISLTKQHFGHDLALQGREEWAQPCELIASHVQFNRPYQWQNRISPMLFSPCISPCSGHPSAAKGCKCSIMK